MKAIPNALEVSFFSMALCWFLILFSSFFCSFLRQTSQEGRKRGQEKARRSLGVTGNTDAVVGSESSVEKSETCSFFKPRECRPRSGVRYFLHFFLQQLIWVKTHHDFLSKTVIWGMPEVVSLFAWVFLKVYLSNTENLMHYKRHCLVGW